MQLCQHAFHIHISLHNGLPILRQPFLQTGVAQILARLQTTGIEDRSHQRTDQAVDRMAQAFFPMIARCPCPRPQSQGGIHGSARHMHIGMSR
jgi:hypothetical protein